MTLAHETRHTHTQTPAKIKTMAGRTDGDRVLRLATIATRIRSGFHFVSTYALRGNGGKTLVVRVRSRAGASTAEALS